MMPDEARTRSGKDPGLSPLSLCGLAEVLYPGASSSVRYATLGSPVKIAARHFSVACLLFASVNFSVDAQSPLPYSPAIEARAKAIVDKMTLDEKLAYVGGTGFGVRAVPRLNLPALEMSDGPYGTRSNSGLPSTTYGAGIGLAASWDPALAEAVGGGIGRDARARGVHYMLGPGVNIYRSPRNGRNFEYFGEDPFLTSQIAVGYINGMQRQGVSATIKHYAANNSEFLRHDSDSIVDQRTLREIYLPAFEAAVKTAHVGAIMDSYNFLNGAHATQNTFLNVEVARRDWHFHGTLMSDWDATYDGIAAANNGLDIEMPTGKFMSPANLAAAIKAGTVTQATIDEKIVHILTTAIEFGWLDRTQREDSISYLDEKNNAVALQSAREGAVLLKNSGLLPLSKSAVKSVLVVGPDAYPGTAVGGGSAGVVPFHQIGPFEGIARAIGSSAFVDYDRGVPSLAHLATATNFTSAAAGGQPVTTLETFANPDLQGDPIAKATPAHIVLDGSSFKSLLADLDSAMAMLFATLPRPVSHRFTGYYDAAESGKYIVVLEGAGEGNGNRVFVDDKLVIDDWAFLRAFQPSVTLDLASGPHKIVVEEFQSGAVGGHLLFAIVPEKKIVNPRAVQLAAKADVVVIAAGFQQESESEAGDRTFALPYGQDELIREIAAANPKTIVTITSGGNVDSNGWLDRVPAVLETWYAGQEGGTALAEILFGDTNPSGHLPATFERHAEDNPTFANYYPEPDSKKVAYKEGIFVGYRGYEHNHTAPLFPFGYGLSYTTFSFANLNIAADPASPRATVTFDVTNSGKTAGAEVAQVYVAPSNSPVPMPEKQLKGFARVTLQPGETKQVSIDLDARAFAYYDVAAKSWKITPGNFGVLVGDSSASSPLKGGLTISPSTASKADFK
jgi:beta-glucosidase